jgi:SHS2 domain-containing protein
MNGYNFIEHPADIAVALTAETLEKLFETGAEAWKASVMENSSTEIPFEFLIQNEANSLEELLVEFLSELNFMLVSKKLVYSKIKSITIEEKNNFKINAALYFEDFNQSWHQLKSEIKAVTYHQMKIQRKDNIYTTKLIFDI